MNGVSKLAGLALVLGAPLLAVSQSGRIAPLLDGTETPPAEALPESTATATFSMYCYWTGEAAAGTVPGVLRTRIGTLRGNEVVRVDYDPSRTGPAGLVRALRAHHAFYAVIAADAGEGGRLRGALPGVPVRVVRGEPRWVASKHSLRMAHPDLLDLGLSERQATALNAWSRFGGPMPDVLTPEQRARLTP